MGRDPEVFRNDTTISGALLYCRLQRWNSGNHWFWKSVLYMFFFCSLFWVFWVELLIKSVLTSKRHKWSSKADKHLFLSEILHNVPVKSASQLFEFMLKVPGLTYVFENLKSLRGREKLISLSTCLKWLSKEREFKSFLKKIPYSVFYLLMSENSV